MPICTVCLKDKVDTDFYKTKGRPQYAQCKSCFLVRMHLRHELNKQTLVAEAGGKCTRCGYNKCTRVLNFHHLEPDSKSFGISDRLSANIEVLRLEAKKCILLCPTCHQEKHCGVW